MNPPDVSNVRIECASAASLDLILHRHHQAIAPNLAPYVDDDTSWAMRRQFYAEFLSHNGSFLFLAYVGEDLVGYTLVLLRATSTMWNDTWVTGDRTAELETLVVAPEQRGKGIGTLLLDQVESELDRLGITDIIIGSLPSNTKTLDMYRRRGFEPTWLVMTRFARRGKT